MNYNSLPPTPTEVSASTILIRLIDGLSFRYHWATEGLTNIEFRPCESSMNLAELLNHIHSLAYIAHQTFQNEPFERLEKSDSLEFLRSETLKYWKNTRDRLEKMSSEDIAACKVNPKSREVEFPFWNVINGPMADALTHVGQITSWRRMDRNPVPKHNPFLGTAG